MGINCCQRGHRSNRSCDKLNVYYVRLCDVCVCVFLPLSSSLTLYVFVFVFIYGISINFYVIKIEYFLKWKINSNVLCNIQRKEFCKSLNKMEMPSKYTLRLVSSCSLICHVVSFLVCHLSLESTFCTANQTKPNQTIN